MASITESAIQLHVLGHGNYIEMLVRPDGRVTITATSPKGYVIWRVEADILTGGPLPLPEDALRLAGH